MITFVTDNQFVIGDLQIGEEGLERLVFPIEASGQFLLKIGFDREPELLDEYLLKNTDIILFVKDQHSLFIFHGVNCAEGNRAILICDQDRIADNTCRPFVTVVECLDIRKQY